MPNGKCSKKSFTFPLYSHYFLYRRGALYMNIKKIFKSNQPGIREEEEDKIGHLSVHEPGRHVSNLEIKFYLITIIYLFVLKTLMTFYLSENIVYRSNLKVFMRRKYSVMLFCYNKIKSFVLLLPKPCIGISI